MKMNFKYVLLACGLVMGLASCSNEEHGEVTPVEGEKTYAQIGLTFKEVKTRAYGEEKATPEEMAIYNGKVYVFNSNKVLQQIVDYNPTKQCIFETTEGTHYFLAMANAPAEAIIPIGTHIDAMDDYIQNINQTVLDGYTSKTTGFFMTSGVNMTKGDYSQIEYLEKKIDKAEKAAVESDGLKAEDQRSVNYISIPVGRAMAKVAARLDLKNGELQHAADAKGTVKAASITYLVTNSPNAMYSFPYFGGLNLFQSPFYSVYNETVAPTAYFPRLHALDGEEPEYGEAVNEGKADNKPVVFYAIENANKTPTYGNSTIVSVRAVFIPSVIFDKADETTHITPVAPTDFYRIRNGSDGKYLDGFYTSRAIAEAAAKDKYGLNDCEVIEYLGGVCYYIIPLDDNQKVAPECYDVVRNHYYDVNITEVLACGYNKPGGDKGTKPVDPLDPKDVWMHATITPKDWVKVTQSGGLGPRN